MWSIAEKSTRTLVGDLCFKGAPTALGEVEIGYGTYSQHQGKGFMTEAISAISQWAFRQPAVQVILAETERENMASHKTLLKNGFSVYKQVDNMLWWRLRRQ